LKPANLFLTQRADGSACIKVLDFGLSKLTDPRMCDAGAKLTSPTDVMGSPHYMAPEQLRATCDADARADLWALGAVLHELLVGKPPFRGETVPEICATVLTQEPPRLTSIRASVPPPVENAVLRCLEKDPEARLPNAAELARAIAPFGTSVARTSCARIERMLEGGGPVSDLSLLPPMTDDRPPSLADWPTDRYAERMRGSSSMRVILGSVLLLGALGVTALMVMYDSVHEGERREGVTAMQPAPRSTATVTTAAASTASAATPTPARAPAPAPETATATGPATASARAEATATAVAKPALVPVHRPAAALPAPRQTPKPAPRPHGPPRGAQPPSGEDVFDGRK
jgi:serine/threonine-protein kinase